MTFKDARAQHSADLEAAAVFQRRQLVKALIDQHIEDAKWQELLHQARQSAELGEKEHPLLRFPSELCTDDARAINNQPNPDWPKTLQGETGELYARWRLKPGNCRGWSSRLLLLFLLQAWLFKDGAV